MSRIKPLSRPFVIGFTLVGLMLTMMLHHWPWSAQAAQRLASALMLRPVAKATLHAQPNAAHLMSPLVAMATLTVNSLEDTAAAGDGKCTLREALNNANAAGQTTGGDCVTGTGTDTISFSVSGTINLTGALPNINSNVTISGPGVNQLEVRRNTGGDYRIFNILAGRTVSLSDLKMTNGRAAGGGGIQNAGTLTLSNCEVSGNTSTSDGGGIRAVGPALTMSNSTISGNSSIGLGGGLVLNRQLGAGATAMTAIITGSTVSGNNTVNGDGGLSLFNVVAEMTNCTISGNTGGPDGGLAISGTDNSSVTLTNCTVTGNTGTAVGGMRTFGVAGLIIQIRLKNTLVAANTPRNFNALAANAPSPISLGNNLDSDGTSGFTNNFNGDIVSTGAPIDAKLGPLADNGGLTRTHLLFCGSPAIDKGTSTGAPATDQRGITRPFNGTVDIGAVEITPALSIDPDQLPGGFAGKPYNQTLTATGGTPAYTFTAVTALPSGLTLSPSGVLSGTLPATGSFSFSVQVTDATGAQGCQAYTLVVSQCPTLTVLPMTPLPTIAAGAEFSQSFSVTTTTPVTLTLIGTVPPGLSFAQFNTTAASLVGTPTQQGNFPFTVRATDANGCFGERSYTLTVNCLTALSINPLVLPAGALGVAYNQTLTANCGTAPFNFTVSAGALPAGLTLSSSGVLSGTPTAVGLSIFTIMVTSANGQMATHAYTLPIYQEQMVSASDGAAMDIFGGSVAINGETAIIGVPVDDVGANVNQGSAYIFVRQGATWTQQAMLTASDGAAGDQFGSSVAISGDTAIVSTPLGTVGANTNQGSAYIFVRQGATWTEQAKLTASDGATGDIFGSSVAISGNTAIVGALMDDVGGNTNQGSAYVFVRSGATWTQQIQLTANDGAANDQFGTSVAISGDTAIVSAPLDTVGANTSQGSAYVFVRSGTSWTQQAKLTASDGATGDIFGRSVSLSGNTAIVGVRTDDIGANVDQGSAYVFVRSGTSWTQQAKLTASDGAANDLFGNSVSLSGNTALIGVPSDDLEGNFNQGSARFFDLSFCPALTINPASLPGGTAGAAYNQTLTATGGTSAYNFTVTAGALPSGLTLSTSGVLSSTPTASGTFNFTVTATDANGCTGTRSYTLTVAAVPTCIPVSILTSLSGAIGSTITVPINVGDLTGRGVTAYDFTLTFDPAVIKPSNMPVEIASTLSNGLTVTPNANTPGRITVSAFGANALTGAGTLLNLKFDLIGATSACSNLTWLNFVFNEGTPCATTSNGQVCIVGGSISGTVNYATAPTTRPVPDVLITAAGTPSATATTSSTGSYSLTGLGGGPYTVTPSKTGQVNGISSFDASLVAQHTAGLMTLTAMQQIAADASNNGSVSSFDASLIAQTVAGLANTGIAGIWKFVPANRSYQSLNGDQTNQNFDAVLVGDVSANWTPPAIVTAPHPETAQSMKMVAEAANPISVSLPQVTGAPDAIVTLPIKVSDLSGRGVVAYDFTLNYDPAVLQPHSAATDAAGTLSSELQITTNTATPGRLTVSVFGAQALAGEGTLLHLKFKVIGGAGAATALTWPDFIFNETMPAAAPATGSFAVEMNSRGISVHTSVSAASFRAGDLASEQIVSAFGVNLAARIEAAASLPLPTELAGTRVEITDSLGIKRTAPLFFVSPQQINYQIPAETAEGAATVMIWRDGQVISTGMINITVIAPALFTVNTSGEGLPAAMILRVDASGAQSYEAIARFDTATNRFVPLPIKLGAETDQVFLILYGTGMRGRSRLDAVNCEMGGEESETLYAGAAPGLVGVDQVNIRLPQSLRGRGEVPLTVTINGRAANTVTVKIE